jgi:hypothetical protein
VIGEAHEQQAVEIVILLRDCQVDVVEFDMGQLDLRDGLAQGPVQVPQRAGGGEAESQSVLIEDRAAVIKLSVHEPLGGLGLRDDRGCGREANKRPGSESTHADPIPHPAFPGAVSTQVPPSPGERHLHSSYGPGLRAASRDCFFDPVDLVSGNIFQKDDLSLLQSWSKDLFDIGQEVGSIHRAIQHKRGRDAIIAQPAYKSRCFPVAVWHLINEPFAWQSKPVIPA